MTRSKRIAEQLGMSHGAATGRLRKSILYEYVKLAGNHFCFKCGAEIENVNEFSIEHKLPWEGRDAELFWNLDNIAFSHLHCNRPHVQGGYKSRIISPEGHAWCGRCKQHLPVENFRKREDSASGYEYRCTLCRTEAMRDYRKK